MVTEPSLRPLFRTVQMEYSGCVCISVYALSKTGFFLKTRDLGIGVLYLLADGFWLSRDTRLASPPFFLCWVILVPSPPLGSKSGECSNVNHLGDITAKTHSETKGGTT